MRIPAILTLTLLFTQTSPTLARTATYTLGDTNTTYNGAGSADDVYVDPAWLAAIASANWPGPISDLDQSRVDHNVPFTFLFPIQPGEVVTAATLSLSLRATHTDVATDGIFLESARSADVYSYDPLGWFPIPGASFVTRSANLANILGVNLLPQLNDGQLNVLVRDDSVVNFATLSLIITFHPGDTNNDGTVDLADLNNVLNNFGSTTPGNPGDHNEDSAVDLLDLNDVLNHFGTHYSPAPSFPVPEPSSALECLLATTPFVIRRRRSD